MDRTTDLLEEILADAARRRSVAGPSRVPPLEDPRIALSAVAEAPPRRVRPSLGARDLTELIDPRTADLRSHRALAGAAVRAAKRALLRFLAEVLDRQGGFNAEAFAAVERLGRRGGRARRILESRLDALEANAARLAGRLSSPTVVGFDYAAFEGTFRGDAARLQPVFERYLMMLADAGQQPVLDLGCGRGAFLEMLRERGVDARGIDIDPHAVAIARSRGLDVSEGDLLEALRAWPDASLGAVVSFQVVEHLPLPKVQDLLHLAHEKLRPDGTLVLETVNVSSAYALAHGWSIDPTHRLRLHPRVLRALAEAAGFQNVELQSAGEIERGDLLESGAALRGEISARLDWIFAPQDCSLVAKR
jgi:2-polyprenyl-3-methyl-5-hydroxy-6-metoxy-1,4-benzoquinol methylase